MIGIKPKGIFFLLLFLGLISFGNAFSAYSFKINPINPDPYLIQYNKVGKLVLGGFLKEIFWNYSKNRIGKVFIHDGQEIFSQYEILSPDQKEVLFSVEPDCRTGDSLCIIKRIEIYNPLFHTAENLKVGMMFHDITHSGQKLSYLGWYRGNLIARTSQNPITYILSTGGIPKKWFSDMDPKLLPFSTKILGIVLTGPELEGYTFRQYDSIQFGQKFLVNNSVINKPSVPINKTLSDPKPTAPHSSVLPMEGSLVYTSNASVKPLIKVLVNTKSISDQKSSPASSNLGLKINNGASIPQAPSNLQTNRVEKISSSIKAPLSSSLNSNLGQSSYTQNLSPISESNPPILPLKDNKTVVKEWLKDTKPKPFVLSSTSGIMTKTPVSNPVSNPIVPSRAEKSSNSSISLNSLSQENVSFIGLEKTKNREAQTSEPKNAGSKVNFIIASANESIYSVSQRYNLSVSEIFDYNPFLSLRKMKPGDKIFLINKDSIPSLQAMDIDPFHTKGPVSKVYLQTKDYSYGNSTGPSNANDSLLFKRGNIPPAVKNK